MVPPEYRLKNYDKKPEVADEDRLVKTEDAEGKSSRIDSDLLTRIIGMINGVSPIMVHGKVTLSRVLKNLSNYRIGYKKNPDECINRRWAGLQSLFSVEAQNYTNLLSSVVTMMAPDTTLAKGCEFVRNIVLLDVITGMVKEKIQPGNQYANAAEWHKRIADHKGVKCPIDISDYHLQQAFFMEMTGMLLVFLGMTPVGTKIKLHTVDDTECDVELVYRTADVTLDEGVYVFHDDKCNHVDMILKLGDLDEYLLFGVYGATIGKKKNIIDPSYCGKALWLAKESFEFPISADRIPYAVIDPELYFIEIIQDHMCILQKNNWNKPVPNEELPYTKANLNNIREIMRSIEQGLSRSYAFVGVPGTGKTRLMEEVRNRCSGSLVVDVTGIGLDDPDFHGYSKFCELLSTAPHQHMLILMDDMDKTEAIDKVSKQLINMFSIMHQRRPGGPGKLTFTFIATINNPTLLGNAIIKRSNRFDEVIKMDRPTMKILGKHMNAIKDAEHDKTNYRSVTLLPAYVYMRMHGMTLADIGNIYDILHIKTSREREKFGAWSLIKAARTIVKNKKNATKEYVL